jgi:hypothetical protein
VDDSLKETMRNYLKKINPAIFAATLSLSLAVAAYATPGCPVPSPASCDGTPSGWCGLSVPGSTCTNLYHDGKCVGESGMIDNCTEIPNGTTLTCADMTCSDLILGRCSQDTSYWPLPPHPATTTHSVTKPNVIPRGCIGEASTNEPG